MFSLCLVDLDRLRNINDARGMEVGDAALTGLVERLRSVLDAPAWHRSEYTLARYDGGAVMVLARPCRSSDGELLAEALRFGVAEQPLGDRLSATVSIGVAQHRIGESIDALLARTERTLHLAKQFGRDRVEVSSCRPRGRARQGRRHPRSPRLSRATAAPRRPDSLADTGLDPFPRSIHDRRTAESTGNAPIE